MTARVHPKPVFILGNQKSGTSAIAGLLSEATGLPVTLDFMAEIEVPLYPQVLRGELTFRDFARHHKVCFSRPLIKEPNITLLYDHLYSYFPNAQFVFVVRDPRDNIRSILDRLQLPGNLPQLTKQQRTTLSPAWGLILDTAWLGFPDGNYVEMLATRWNIMADILLAHSKRMVMVRYEDFVRDKPGAISRLAAQLGMHAPDDISLKMNVQFQPQGRNKDLDWQTFFGEDNLHRIEQRCAPRMQQLRYTTVTPLAAKLPVDCLNGARSLSCH
jgi:hypothetical protein